MVAVSLKKKNWEKQDLKNSIEGDLQDGRGVRRGDHLPPHKYIKNTSMDFPSGTVVKNLPDSAGGSSSIPDPGISHMPQSN